MKMNLDEAERIISAYEFLLRAQWEAIDALDALPAKGVKQMKSPENARVQYVIRVISDLGPLADRAYQIKRAMS